MPTQQQHRLLDEPYYCSNPAFFFPELHIHRTSQKPCEICLGIRKQEIKKPKKSIWLVGWLAKKCQSFFFHELHIHRTSQKPLRKLYYTQTRKTARTRGLPPASCWLTNVSEVKSYNPRQDTALIRRFLLVQLCATNEAKTRKVRNTTTVGDSTPNHVTW